MIRAVLIRLQTQAARYAGDRRGLAAIEFAFILPILITLYFGLTELVRAVDNGRKVTLFARTVADLSGRVGNSSSSAGDMDKILSAAGAILRPFDATKAKVVVNAMGVEKYGGALVGGVCSSYPPASARPTLQFNGTNGLPATPATYQFDGARYILAEVTMPYAPIIGDKLYKWIFGSKGLVITRQIAWAQRTDSEIVLPGGAPCPKVN